MSISEIAVVSTTQQEASLPLQNKILTRQTLVGVIGLGYVGLPLALSFSNAGFIVTGFDMDSHKISALRTGRGARGENVPVGSRYLRGPSQLRPGHYRDRSFAIRLRIHRGECAASLRHPQRHERVAQRTRGQVLEVRSGKG